MEEENISVEETTDELDGNVPATDDGAVTEPTETEEKPETTTPEPKEPEAQLFELPDGRKVDAETLSREWKENFMPDYTKKATALKEMQNNNPSDQDPLKDPNYIPPTYDELAQKIEARMIAKMEAAEKERQSQRQAVEDEVTKQINELKKVDPTLDENALFLHANKYGFRDLQKAHANIQDMNKTVKKAQTVAAANATKRNDPVSSATTPGTGAAPVNPSMFENARDFLRSIKN